MYTANYDAEGKAITTPYHIDGKLVVPGKDGRVAMMSMDYLTDTVKAEQEMRKNMELYMDFWFSCGDIAALAHVLRLRVDVAKKLCSTRGPYISGSTPSNFVEKITIGMPGSLLETDVSPEIIQGLQNVGDHQYVARVKARIMYTLRRIHLPVLRSEKSHADKLSLDKAPAAGTNSAPVGEAAMDRAQNVLIDGAVGLPP